ncbi:MAG: insulinase family protein [Anaerolineales bacterium]|nr:insulinase family protein [Anaerolineales bacterium]
MTSSIHSLPGADDIHRVELPNGIVVLARANFNSPSVVINGYLLAGGLLDPDEKLGLADFVSSALMRGTHQREFQKIYDELESVGASFGYNSGTHYAGFGGRSLVEDLPLLLDVMADTLQNPAFPTDQVEKLRAQMLTGLAIRAQDTSDMASLTFDQLLYDGHPYSRPDEGWPETVQAITLDDLKEFHRKYYGPRGMVIAVVGAVEPEKAVEEVERMLGSWQNEAQADAPELPAFEPPAKTVRRHYAIPGKSQSDIVMGTHGPKRNDPEYMSVSLGNNILGQFGLMGRIGDVVREQSGLAYYAHSSLSAGIGPGAWYVSAGVNPSNVDKAIDLIRRELKRYGDEGVTSEELSDSQANFIGRLPLSLESNGGVAGSLINIERYDLGLDYYRQYSDLVQAVTLDDVRESAQKYIDPDRLVIATAGP